MPDEQPNPAGDGGATPPAAPAAAVTPPAGEGTKPPAVTKPDGEGDKGQEEPQARKTPRDHYLERLKRREAKAADPKPGEQPPAADPEIDPAEEEKISKVVDKRFGTHIEKLEEGALKAEVDTFISQNPEYKPYQAKIERWAKHPAYANVPMEQLVYAAVGKDLQKIGADKARAADEEARKSATGGGSGRTVTPGKPVSEMTSAEFQAFKEAKLQEARQ